jgi:hypothetical protein
MKASKAAVHAMRKKEIKGGVVAVVGNTNTQWREGKGFSFPLCLK